MSSFWCNRILLLVSLTWQHSNQFVDTESPGWADDDVEGGGGESKEEVLKELLTGGGVQCTNVMQRCPPKNPLNGVKKLPKVRDWRMLCDPEETVRQFSDIWHIFAYNLSCTVCMTTPR